MVRITSAHGDTDLSLPTEDPRIYTTDMDDDWKLFQQTHTEMLKVYNLIITDFLSHSDGIDLASLREKLIYEYYINKEAVNQALHFIRSGNARNVQFEIGDGNKLVIFRSPKLELSRGSYCIFPPTIIDLKR